MENNRKQEIIDAAIRLFNERGFDLTSMMDIAKEVGITKSTLYFYYDSKAELIHSVYRYCHLKDVEACNLGLDLEKNALDKLCRRFKNIIEYSISHPKEAFIEHIYGISPIYGDTNIGINDDFYKDVVEILELGIQEGSIKDVPTWIMANAFYGMARQMYSSFLERPDTWNEENEKICFDMIRSMFAK